MVAVIAGRVGCYGGMSIVASLCSTLIMSRVGRLGLNGPEVIEQEAGIGEFDASDRPTIWRLTGGVRRVEQGHADCLVDDTIDAVRSALYTAFSERSTRNRLSVERLQRSFAEVVP